MLMLDLIKVCVVSEKKWRPNIFNSFSSCYSCVPMNRRLLSEPRAPAPCGLVQSMIAYWETSGCCRRCQEAAAATACHLAYHQASCSRRRRHRRRHCYSHCRCQRPTWVCCDSSYCCYCSNSPPQANCNYSCPPLIIEVGKFCRNLRKVLDSFYSESTRF